MTKDWQAPSREALEKFMTAVQAELGPQAMIAEIEQAMLRHYQQLLSEVMQSLVDKQATFPPEPEQGRVAQRRTCEKPGPSSVG